jgi:hypothetical protein
LFDDEKRRELSKRLVVSMQLTEGLSSYGSEPTRRGGKEAMMRN